MIALSMGMGLQSVTISVMACLGDLPMPDMAVFADTGWELRETYDYATWFIPWARERGLDIQMKREGDIRADAFKATRWANMPLFVRGEDGKAAPLLRQCSQEYKIAVVNRIVRARMGLEPGQRHDGEPATIWLGFSMDELERMKVAAPAWFKYGYPLIDTVKMDRSNCEDYLRAKGLPVPAKSACVGCPWRSDLSWASMKKHRPLEWAEACAFDAAIRHARPDIEQPVFLHRSLVPLAEAYLGEDQGDMFINECGGPCNT